MLACTYSIMTSDFIFTRSCYLNLLTAYVNGNGENGDCIFFKKLADILRLRILLIYRALEAMSCGVATTIRCKMR